MGSSCGREHGEETGEGEGEGGEEKERRIVTSEGCARRYLPGIGGQVAEKLANLQECILL